MAGAIASAMLFAFPAFAQDSRLSLADRVARLEQQAQNKDQTGTGMVNQMQQLQAQVQQLQGQVEELQHQLQTLEDKNKAQYTDLDARLGRLEGGGAGAGAAAAGNNPQAQVGNPAATASAATAASNAAAGPPAIAGSKGAATGDPAAAQAAYDVAFKAIRAGNDVEASREFRRDRRHPRRGRHARCAACSRDRRRAAGAEALPDPAAPAVRRWLRGLAQASVRWTSPWSTRACAR